MNWVSCVTARQDIVELIVKVCEILPEYSIKYEKYPDSSLKCPYDPILDIHFFHICALDRSFTDMSPNFNLSSIRT